MSIVDENIETIAPESPEVLKARLEQNLTIVHDFEGTESVKREKFIKRAKQNIVEQGSNILPVLKETLLTDDNPYVNFDFAQYVSWIATPVDLDFVLEAIADPRLTKDEDGSALDVFADTVYALNLQIREKNPKDPRLERTAQSLIEILDNGIENNAATYDVAAALASTGTQLAVDYFSNHTEFKGHFEEVYNDIIQKYEYAKGWAPLNPRFEPDANYTFTQLYEEENTLQGSGEQEFKLFEQLTGEEIILHKRNAQKAYKYVDENFPSIDETILPAVRLVTYNFLRNNPSPTEQQMKELHLKVTNLAKHEQLAQMPDNPLPTLGIEIEYLRKNLSGEARVVADTLGIPNLVEPSTEWEINPGYSYSALAQSRVLMELAKLGAFRLTPGDTPKERIIPKEDMLSLHINLAMPILSDTPVESNPDDDAVKLEHAGLEKYRNDFETLVDMFTYAFASPERIKMRKTHESFYIKDRTASSAKVHGSEEDNLLRLELRTPEFRDFPSFIMIPEAQRISSMLFSYLKKCENRPLTKKEADLASLWVEYKSRGQKILGELTPYKRFYDYKPEEAADILVKSEIKGITRQLNDEFFIRSGQILNQ